MGIIVLYHHAEPDWWKAKENDTELNVQIVERFEAEGIQFAFPTRTLHLHDETRAGPVVHQTESPGSQRRPRSASSSALEPPEDHHASER